MASNMTKNNKNKSRRETIKSIGLATAGVIGGSIPVNGDPEPNEETPPGGGGCSKPLCGYGDTDDTDQTVQFEGDVLHLGGGSALRFLDGTPLGDEPRDWFFRFAVDVSAMNNYGGRTRDIYDTVATDNLRCNVNQNEKDISTQLSKDAQWSGYVVGEDYKGYDISDALTDTVEDVLNAVSDLATAATTASDIWDYWQKAFDSNSGYDGIDADFSRYNHFSRPYASCVGYGTRYSHTVPSDFAGETISAYLETELDTCLYTSDGINVGTSKPTEKFSSRFEYEMDIPEEGETLDTANKNVTMNWTRVSDLPEPLQSEAIQRGHVPLDTVPVYTGEVVRINSV